MSSDGKEEATILVNEDELAKTNIEDESVSSEGSSDHGKIVWTSIKVINIGHLMKVCQARDHLIMVRSQSYEF